MRLTASRIFILQMIFAVLILSTALPLFAQSQQEVKAKEEKLKFLRENVCAPNETEKNKAKTEAVGACPECVKEAQKDQIAKIKIDTSAGEIRQRDLAFLRQMQGSGRFNTSNGICSSISLCEKKIKEFEDEIVMEKKNHEESMKALQSYIDSDMSKTPLPRTKIFRKILGDLIDTDKNSAYKSKVNDAYSQHSYKSNYILNPDLVDDFVSLSKKTLKKEFTTSETLTSILEQVKNALKKIEEQEKSEASDEEFNKLEKLANDFIRQKIEDLPGFQRCGMTTAEIFALMDYSGNGYKEINPALRKGGEDAQKFENYKQVLNSALGKLRKYNDFVDRGAELPDKVLESYQVGAVIDSPAFTSTGAFNGFQRKTKFTIKTKTGAFIAPFSRHSGENEVLIPAGVKFKVLDRKPADYGRTEIVMEEVDP